MITLNRDKLLARLEKAKQNHIRDRLTSLENDNYSDALVYQCGECTIDSVIELVMSDDYLANGVEGV